MEYQQRAQRLAETFQPRQEWWSRVFASPVAKLILSVVADWPAITPNRLTVLSFILTLVASALIYWGNTIGLIMVGAVLQVAYIIDCMDGQLARYRGIACRKGSFYDKWADLVKFPFVIFALTLVSFHRSGSELPFILGLICIFLIGYLPYLKLFTEHEFGIQLWSGLSGGDFVQRNLRFFLFEEAQWYLIVSVCLFMDRPLLGLILIASTQCLVAIARTWRIFRLV
ncbi:MAG: CDP-alcohol phosphatidyltransferase family protein [Opitutaceae bacterium]|nr:CDP-alcohol phosphatidyltransferase family protein [Opitutaceae bacterium]